MFCYQCQETKSNSGCVTAGVCGKSGKTANLQDLLIYVTKGLSFCVRKTLPTQVDSTEADRFVNDALFSTVTNTNFDDEALIKLIKRGVEVREHLKMNARAKANMCASECGCELPEQATYFPKDNNSIYEKAEQVSILNEKNEDIRSLTETLVYGIKGVAAYAHHAEVLGLVDKGFNEFKHIALTYTIDENKNGDELLKLILECGKQAVNVMAMLDKANTSTFGMQQVTEVSRGTKANHAILVTGHDLKDLYELLVQTDGQGIDIYTHGEMLPAHAYPKLKGFKHLIGNFGTSWYNQQKEFENFSGAILFTTNCIQKPRENYANRVFTTGVVTFTGIEHIADRKDGMPKDFSKVIDVAKKSAKLQPSDAGKYTIGFAKDTLLSVADKVVEAVKSGAITKFVVMAGCDGRSKDREFFTEYAKSLPKSAIILTAGCAKYRYNDIDFGDIAGIPRLLDAGQCNDSYSLAFIALKLQEAFALDDINKLPIEFEIGWYEQKAVAVLLALLSLGFKNVKVGPTLPAFLSPNVANKLVEMFSIGKCGN